MSNPTPNNPYGKRPQQPGQGEPGFGEAPGAAPVPAASGPVTGHNAPYGYDPFGRPYSDKSKIVAGVLTVFLGPLGIGRFYTGHTRMAVGQLVTLGGLGLWSLIDGILLLTVNGKTDSDGRVLRG